ncbi:MAG: Lrp/AsnC family transcriptional regulator [Woeseiaceae bacterium]|nr:Lrp/AsnC family transcriptional regulator [Woeseiaceae bacterium]
MTLDRKDRAILTALQQDSRVTMQQLAVTTGMSASACWRRVRALEEAGVIDRYAVLVNPRKAGFALSSMTLVSLARHEQKNVEHFIREVEQHPEYPRVLSRPAVKPTSTCAWSSRIWTPITASWTISFSNCPGCHSALEHRAERDQGRYRIAVSRARDAVNTPSLRARRAWQSRTDWQRWCLYEIATSLRSSR